MNREKRDRSLRAILGEGEIIELCGEEWRLYPLKPADILEIEEWTLKSTVYVKDAQGEYLWDKDDTGHSTRRIEREAVDSELAIFMLWLGLRKNGCTPQLLAERQWGLDLEDVALMIPVERVGELLDQMMRISGLDPEKKREPLSPDRLGQTLLPGSDQAVPLPATIS